MYEETDSARTPELDETLSILSVTYLASSLTLLSVAEGTNSSSTFPLAVLIESDSVRTGTNSVDSNVAVELMESMSVSTYIGSLEDEYCGKVAFT